MCGELCGEISASAVKGLFQELFSCFTYQNILIRKKVIEMEALLCIQPTSAADAT